MNNIKIMSRAPVVYVVACFLMNSIKEFILKIDKERIQSRVINQCEKILFYLNGSYISPP